MKEITTWGWYGRQYVSVNGERVAMMTRSPFTGEWIGYARGKDDEVTGQHMFFAPSIQTFMKTPQAAAKFIVKEIQK
jgi:hypothetical protein